MTTRIQIDVGWEGQETERRMVDIEKSDGGLALHRAPEMRPLWTITHIVSGLAVLKGIPNRVDGLTALHLLDGVTDWERTAEEVTEEPTELARIRREILVIAENVNAMRPIWADQVNDTNQGE